MSSIKTRWASESQTKASNTTSTISSNTVIPADTGNITFLESTLTSSDSAILVHTDLEVKPTSNNTSTFTVKNTSDVSILNVGTTTGKVGIGTASPYLGLQVASSGGADPTSSGAVASGVAMFSGGSSDASIVMGRMSGIARNWIQVQTPANTAITSNHDLLLQPLYGKVGIGETSPDKLLHLKGDDVDGILLKLEGNVSYGGTIEYHKATSYHWRTGVGGASSTNSTIGASSFGIEDGTTNIERIGIGHSNGLISLKRTGNKEVARFTSTSITGSRITILSDSGNSSTVGERDGHLVLQDSNTRKVAIGFDQPDSLLHMSGADPYMTFTNTALEDSEAGRESKLIFEGTTVASGATYDSIQHHLAEINVSHYKDQNDKKGQFTFKVNDGNDANGSLQTAVNIDSYKNVVIGGRTSFNGTTGSCAGLYAEYTGSAMGTASHAAAIKAVIDEDNSSDTFPPSGAAKPGLLIVNKDSTTNSFSTLQFSNTSDAAGRPVATIASRAIHGAQSQGLLSIGVGGAAGATHNSQILALRKSSADTWVSITNVKDADGDNNASDGDDKRKSVVKFVGVTQDGGATYDAVEHDLANIVVSHHGTANDKKGKFKILLNDGDDADGSLNQAMFIGSDEGHTALGLSAGAALGDSHHNQYNTFIGKNAGVGTDTGDGNVAIGTGSLYYNQKANFNTAVGYEAAKFIQHSGGNSDTDMYNTAIGHSAMFNCKQGINNTIIGASAGYTLESANNIAIGKSALSTEDWGSNSLAIGSLALQYQNSEDSDDGTSLGSIAVYNLAIGNSAGRNVENGTKNTIVGHGSLQSASGDKLDGDNNSTFGYSSGYALKGAAASNTLLGAYAGYAQTVPAGNTMVGKSSGYHGTTGTMQTFVGFESCMHVTGGTNTIMGYKAMYNGSTTVEGEPSYTQNTAHSNTVIGAMAMAENTDAALTAARNCILGAYAGKEMLSSDDCILIGYSAGVNLTTGDENILIGFETGAALTDNSNTICIGYKAGKALVSGAAKNTHVGYYSGILLGHTENDNNTTLGYNSMGGGHATASQNTANDNVAIGVNACGGEAPDDTAFTSEYNVVIGSSAGEDMISANNNVIMGYNAAKNITTSDENVIIGAEAGQANGLTSGTILIGYEAGNKLGAGSGQNTIIGTSAGKLLGGLLSDNSVIIGFEAGGGGHATHASNALYQSTAIGYQALGAGTDDSTALISQSNVAIGYQALYACESSLGNIAIGTQALVDLTTGGSNMALGFNSGANITTGSRNTSIGTYSGDLISTGSNNTLVGYGTDVDVATNSYQTRIGHYGALRYLTAQITLDDFSGSPIADDMATTALLKIPKYGFLKRVTATVVQASGSNASYNINIIGHGRADDSDGDLSPGAAIPGGAGSFELIGSDATIMTGCSSMTQAAPSVGDSNQAINAAKYVHIWEADVRVGACAGWMPEDAWLYVLHSASNTTDATNMILRITAEYFGED